VEGVTSLRDLPAMAAAGDLDGVQRAIFSAAESRWRLRARASRFPPKPTARLTSYEGSAAVCAPWLLKCNPDRYPARRYRPDARLERLRDTSSSFK